MAFGSQGLYLSTHAAGVQGIKEGFGVAKGTPLLGRALGLGGTLFSAISGYQEGGTLGAARELASYAATNYVFNAVTASVAGNVVIGGAAIGAAALYGRHKAAEIGYSRHRRNVRLEMGTPVVDPFGSVATMRQRSLQALSNSRLNGMTALGNEASLLFRNY